MKSVRKISVLMIILAVATNCCADKRMGGQQQTGYRKQHAIVIGINYNTLSPAAQLEVPQLQTAEQDAQAVHDTLIEYYGFQPDNVHLLLGKAATLNAIRSRFGTEYLGDARTVEEDDSVLIFYAGHGVRQQKHGAADDFVGMLYPADLHVIEGKGVDPVSCLRIDDMLRMLQDYCAAKHKLLVLDSCHSGEVFNFKSSRSAGVNRGFRSNLFRAPALQAIAAAQATQVAADADASGEHSPFTRAFLDALQHGPTGDSQTLFTASELFAFIPNRVRKMQNIQQDPRGGWLDGEGDFYFFPKNLRPFVEMTDRGAAANTVAAIPDSVAGERNSVPWATAGIVLMSGLATAWWLRRSSQRRLELATGVAIPNSIVAEPPIATSSVATDQLYLQVVGSPYAYRAPPGAESVSIGRQRRKAGQAADQGNDFVIRVADSDEKTRLLSRRHLQITRVGNAHFVTDTSTAGTQLNDQPLIRGTATAITSGDKLTVAGVLTLQIQIRGQADHTTQHSVATAASEVELSPWNNTGVVVEATLGDMVTMEEE